MKDPTSRFCFGKYDIRGLLPVVQKKFVDGFSIVELLEEAQNDEEKEKVAIVALLDLETVMHMLSDKRNKSCIKRIGLKKDYLCKKDAL